MKLEIKNESENKLLHRKELDVLLKELDATPSRKEVTSFLAANLGVPEGNIVVEEIHQEYGVKEVDCYVKVYENEALKNEIEPKQEEPKKEEEQPKEEKPAEVK
jgi:ribosomal protein S24E